MQLSVYKDDYRCVAHTAHLHQLKGLALYPFGSVYYNNYAVDCRQCAVGIFGKILMAGGVEDINPQLFVIECHYRCGYGDSPLFFDFHEVGGGRFLDFIRFYGSRNMNSAAKQQQFFGEGGFPGIGVGNNGKRPPAVNLLL